MDAGSDSQTRSESREIIEIESRFSSLLQSIQNIRDYETAQLKIRVYRELKRFEKRIEALEKTMGRRKDLSLIDHIKDLTTIDIIKFIILSLVILHITLSILDKFIQT
jgi:cytidylate kinase